MISPIPGSPSSVYRNRVACGDLHLDASQQQALEYFDQLHISLCAGVKPRSRVGRWVERIIRPAPDPAIGCYLWGGVGTGKTLLMDIFYSSLGAGIGYRTHFHRFMRSVHEQKNRIRDRQDPLAIIARDFAATTRVLCLDEFTVSDITDAMILSGLLRHLFRNGVMLVTTSNTPIPELYRDGLQRSRFLPAIGLLQKHTRSINVDGGNDYRMAYLVNSDIFHVPADAGSEEKLAQAFAGLSGAGEGPARTININDRKIAVRAEESGVVWFDFAEICQTHRSNSDYIEIARQYHSVLVSAIPHLPAAMDDAARRLIELVDELYDRNVNLLASSQCHPHEIYSGHRLKQPFQRTSSRLTEMSSRDYLSRPHLS
jgi:cell division protein ZapE